MLAIASINVNGIRAATKQRSPENRGFFQWLGPLDNPRADVILIQEVRADEQEALIALAPAIEAGWHYYAAPCLEQKGYAGVAILSRYEITNIRTGLPQFLTAGRYIEGTLKTPTGMDLRIASVYLPTGKVNTERQDEKYRFLDVFQQHLWASAEKYPNMLVCGDWNICHRQQDLKNWKANRTSSGFLADERAFMDNIVGFFPDYMTQLEKRPRVPERFAVGTFYGAVNYKPSIVARARLDAYLKNFSLKPVWFDVVRQLDPEGTPYTWWSYRGRAFADNAGWRIDYHVATASVNEAAEEYVIDRAPSRDMCWSDHAPVIVRYNI